MTEDAGYQEMLAQFEDVTRRLPALDAKLHGNAARDLAAGESIEERLKEYGELRRQRDQAERNHMHLLRAIWTLKANWR